MDLQNLHWLEWLGFALVAYGLGAGAVRGLTQQFTRFLVWIAGLACVGAMASALIWLAERFADQPHRQAALANWFALTVFLLAIVLLGGMRRMVFGRVGSANSLADKLLGALLGVGVGITAWILLVGTAHNAYRLPQLEEELSFEWARVATIPYRKLPEVLQSPLFQFEPHPALQPTAE
ncbi:MAG: CvpA family protein [Planctomycetes bacterium]|nr:CvpA family protein [Planctomycetota bacterium]